MSEYQFFEFMAIDRMLTSREIGELRRYSTRARITPTSFVNHYNWGDFRGDEDEWMEKYFDAFLYFANWGSHVLKLRFPSTLLSLETAQQYCHADCAESWEHAGRVIVSVVLADEEGSVDDWDGGEGRLAEIVPVRAEIARGDLRGLYLMWLACAESGGVEDDEVEPPIPPNLKDLSDALKRLSAFLNINPYTLDAAIAASPTVESIAPDRSELTAWVAALPQQEKDEMLLRAVVEEDFAVGRSLAARYDREHRRADMSADPEPVRRTVAEILDAADALRSMDEEKKAAEKKSRALAAMAARKEYLLGLAGSEWKLWAKVESLVAMTQPKSYDEALVILKDLRDLAVLQEHSDFAQRLDALRAANARKPSLMGKLRKAGM